MSTQTSTTLIPEWTFGDHIRKARSVAHMDQRAFATALGVPPGTLAAWETDRTRPRDLVAVAKRVELLTRVPATWILGLHENGPRPGVSQDEDPFSRPRRESNPHATGSTSAQVIRLDRYRRSA